MSVRDRFSTAEWEIVSALPSQAAIAAAVSDGVAVIGTIRELNEGIDAIEEGATAYPGNELIAAILDDMNEQFREEEQADEMIAEGGASPSGDQDVGDLPLEATQPRSETTSSFTGDVVLTSAANDAVAAWEVPEVDPRDPDAFIHEVIANAMQAREILAARTTTDEAANYRAWVHGIIERVVNRSKSGGFLGIGGRQVGAEENQFQREFAAAFGD